MELESEVKTLNSQCERDRQIHKIAQDAHRATLKELEIIKSKEVTTQQHVRKMTQIIAMKGGILG